MQGWLDFRAIARSTSGSRRRGIGIALASLAILTSLMVLQFTTTRTSKDASEAGRSHMTVVTIGSSDVEAFGGWPLNRRWYALAVQNLIAAGAERIYLDIAFPHANASHAEADEFFLHVLKENPNVYLLGDEAALAGDSVTVFGSSRLPSGRFFAPFSSTFKVDGRSMVVDAAVPRSFVAALLPGGLPARPLLVAMPKSPPDSGVSFMSAVQGTLGPLRGDVVVGLDYPGVTSYVANSRGRQPVPTTALQIHAAEKLRAGDYRRQWPAGGMALLFAAALVPMIAAGRDFRRRRWIGVSGGLCIALPLVLAFGRVHVSISWYMLALVPLGLLAYVVMRDTRRESPSELVTPDPDPAEKKELEDLRWQLRFYEHLERPESVASTEERGSGIRYAPTSPLVAILARARKIAQSDLSVLILGESGVGKELLARYVHDHSDRSSAPFQAINCAAVPAELIEAELFGHERGAFTGAHGKRVGLFERTNGGTLFLDEVGETSMAFQTKLLRVLQEGSFLRVGGSQRVSVSVRVLAATHRDLQEAIHDGSFREDLYYRLHGITLTIPPLRDRPDDAVHLFEGYLREADGAFKASDALTEWIRAQPWPGNVRELKAATQRAVLNAEMKRRAFLLPQDFELNGPLAAPVGEQSLSDRVLEELRRQNFHARSISGAAEVLGVHRATVTEHLRGWVIRFLSRSGGDIGQVTSALRGPGDGNDDILRKRVEGYVKRIRQRIIKGIREGDSDDAIKLGRFRNTPQEFHPDLDVLINRHRGSTG